MPKASNSADSLLSEKKSAVTALLGRVNTINDEFKFIYGNSRADITMEMNEIAAAILAASAALSAAPKAGGAEPVAFGEIALRAPTRSAGSAPEGVFGLGELIGACDDGFTRIAEIVGAFDVAGAPAGASYTYLMTTQQDIDAFDQQHEKYKADALTPRIHDDLVMLLCAQALDEVEQAYMSRAHCDLLFARYIAAALQKMNGEQQIPYLEALERAKTRALVGKEERKQSATIWPLQRFGLIPGAQGLSVAQLADHFFPGAKIAGSSIDGFIELARAKKVNLAVIRAIVRNPIEHNINALIAPTELKIYDANAGVNDAILARFNMTRKRASENSVPGYAMQEHPNAPGDRRWIVARMIDGALYDVMRALNDDKVDVAIIERMRRGPSARIDAYNGIKGAAFAQHIRAPPELGEKVKKANKALINSLVARITGRILQYIDKALVPLPADPKGIEDAISDPRFVEIMQEEFLASYSEVGLDSYGSAPEDEMVGTFIADLEGSIAIQFARAIKLNMIELGPGAKIFRELSGAALHTRIYNLFVDVIKRSVSSSILTKENVFEKILIKDHVLTALSRQLNFKK